MNTMMAFAVAADQQTTGQDSDPDMDEALRRVRQEPPLPRPRSAAGRDRYETGVLFELELDILGIRPVALARAVHADAPWMGVGGDDGDDDSCPLCGYWTCRC